MYAVVSVITVIHQADTYVSFGSFKEFNSGLLHLLKTRLQSLHLQRKSETVFKEIQFKTLNLKCYMLRYILKNAITNIQHLAVLIS